MPLRHPRRQRQRRRHHLARTRHRRPLQSRAQELIGHATGTAYAAGGGARSRSAGYILAGTFEDRITRRGIIVAEGDRIACQAWIEGTFTAPFTHSPVGKLEPNGARVVWDLTNMFKFDDRGRPVEEIVRTGNRSFLRRLGPEVG